MQFGHIGIALAVASVDPRPETFAVVGVTQFLPNADSLVVRSGLARPEFHGTWSHTFSRRRFSLNLWKNTGYWGRSMYAGFYSHPWAWILEGAVFVVVVWRYARYLV
jgi:hypothetical protein